MSEIEIYTYAALSCVVFIWGIVLVIKKLIAGDKSKRVILILKLVAWLMVPPLLGIFAMAAMMDPRGGEPVVTILRLIFIFYITVGAAVILYEHRQNAHAASSQGQY